VVGVYLYMDVCLSFRMDISEIRCPSFTEFSSSTCYGTYRRGSFLLWRRCNMLCIYGFVDDIIFVNKMSYLLIR